MAATGERHGSHQPALGHRRHHPDGVRPLGWANWLLIPFAVVGAIIAAIGIAVTSPQNLGRAKTGLVLNGIVIIVGIVSLSMGGGLL